MRLKVEKYFRRYLEIAPLGLAIWRSVEAKHLATVKLKRPIMDIGCGFGEFAYAFVDDQIEMGVDNAPKDLFAAARVKKYKNLTLADARELPFCDNSFGSIISISTMEHIPHPERVFKEAYRVLKPKGILAITMETDKVDENTFYKPFLKNIGLRRLSLLLQKAFDTLFHRHELLPKEKWIKQIEKTGFKIDREEDIISPTIVKLFDIFLVTSWPAQLAKPFLGRRVVYRPKFITDLLVRIFLKYLDEKDKNGTNLFIVAHKPMKHD